MKKDTPTFPMLRAEPLDGQHSGQRHSTEDIHIASLVVQCQPSCQGAITEHCQSMSGNTVYTGDKPGTFVVVVETVNESHISLSIDAINQLAGVISTSLVYHHCESQHSLEEELSS